MQTCEATRPALPRPTVLTPGVKSAVLGSLAAGNFISAACSAAGLNRSVFYQARRSHRAGGPHAEFFRQVDVVLAAAEILMLRRVLEAGPGWRASAWLLARRFPGRWGASLSTTSLKSWSASDR